MTLRSGSGPGGSCEAWRAPDAVEMQRALPLSLSLSLPLCLSLSLAVSLSLSLFLSLSRSRYLSLPIARLLSRTDVDAEGLATGAVEDALTNPPGHLWREKWTALSGPLSHSNNNLAERTRHLVKVESRNLASFSG